jgi:hypothetical protein
MLKNSLPGTTAVLRADVFESNLHDVENWEQEWMSAVSMQTSDGIVLNKTFLAPKVRA